MVSILLLTIDRSEVTKNVVTHNLDNAGHPYELCILDNGSKEKAIIEFIESLNAAVLIKSKINQGVAKGLNTLMKLATGDYFFHMANDIVLPQMWLRQLVEHYQRIVNAGMVGIHCVEPLPPLNEYGVHAGWNVFGSTMISRQVFNKIGYYNEDYNPYGLEDSDYHHRLNKSGYMNFYIPNATAIHKVNDVGEKTDYRIMKDNSLTKNVRYFSMNVAAYDRTNNYYVSDDPIINQKQFFNSMIRTPKGIMYLIKTDEQFAYCYDDQTGKDEIFLLTEVKAWGNLNI